MMPDCRGTFIIAPPVLAGEAHMGRERGAIWTRAGKDIVLIWLITASIDHFTFFVQCGLFIDVVIAMQVFHIPSDQFAFRIKPGSLTDTIACMYRGRVVFRVFPVDSSGITIGDRPRFVENSLIVICPCFSINSKTIYQPGAARALECLLTTAPAEM